jgi:CheY-like chemotaxis protein
MLVFDLRVSKQRHGSTRQSNEGVRRMRLRVLIAEDEALVALSLADLLEAEGYEVVVAADGVEALVEARRMGDALDALVTDLNMPRMTGEDLIRALRVERPGLPVVVVTGSAPPGGLEELCRYGGGYGPLVLLHKPIDYGDLVDTLRRAVCPKVPDGLCRADAAGRAG